MWSLVRSALGADPEPHDYRHSFPMEERRRTLETIKEQHAGLPLSSEVADQLRRLKRLQVKCRPSYPVEDTCCRLTPRQKKTYRNSLQAFVGDFTWDRATLGLALAQRDRPPGVRVPSPFLTALEGWMQQQGHLLYHDGGFLGRVPLLLSTHDSDPPGPAPQLGRFSKPQCVVATPASSALGVSQVSAMVRRVGADEGFGRSPTERKMSILGLVEEHTAAGPTGRSFLASTVNTELGEQIKECLSALRSPADPEQVRAALCFAFNVDWLGETLRISQPRGAASGSWPEGLSALTAVELDMHVYLANIGRCSAYLVKNSRVLPLTRLSESGPAGGGPALRLFADGSGEAPSPDVVRLSLDDIGGHAVVMLSSRLSEVITRDRLGHVFRAADKHGDDDALADKIARIGGCAGNNPVDAACVIWRPPTLGLAKKTRCKIQGWAATFGESSEETR